MPAKRPSAPIADPQPALEIRGISKSYGPVVALRDVCLSVRRGEFLTLLGPSGCGKTTLLYIIGGFVPADRGDLFIAGARASGLAPSRRDIGVVFQNYALFPHMTVAQNVAFGLRMRRVRGAELRRRVDAVLEIVRLPELGARLPRELSGGQQQRVALARALVIEPSVLLMDESLSALDRTLRRQMQLELRDIQRRLGVTTIFVTHDQSEALTLSDRIAVMSQGEIQQISTPLEIYRQPSNGFVAAFVGEINRLSGRVLAADADGTAIELGVGTRLLLPAARTAALTTGQEVSVFIRPEALKPLPESAEATLRGRIVAHVFQGAFVDLFCRIEGAGTIHLRALGHASMASHPVGSMIAIGVEPDEIVVLPAAG